jgi:hypothetical protein
MHSARDFRDEFHRLPDRPGGAPDYFIKLAAFDEFHAEVTRPVAFAHFVYRDNARMFEARGSFGFKAKALYVHFARPLTKSNDL